MGDNRVEVTWPDPGVAVVTVAREEALNALNADVMDQLEAALTLIESRGEARVAIVTGKGSRSFVAGAGTCAHRSAPAPAAGYLRQKVHAMFHLR